MNKIVGPDQFYMSKLCDIETLKKELKLHRNHGKKVVFTNGCFDIIHRGHIECLRFCKAHGDIVVVGLNSDSSIRQIKGSTRPINDQSNRAAVLSELESVDYVTIFDDSTPLNLIVQIMPDILVKGEDWSSRNVVGREVVEALGGNVLFSPVVKGMSTSSIIKQVSLPKTPSV